MTLRAFLDARRWAVLCLSLLFPMSLSASEPASPGVVHHYATPEGETYFALSLRADRLAAAELPACDHVVLMDTSASQTGEYRLQALNVLKAFLQQLPADDRVMIYAVDVQAEPLTQGFLAPAHQDVKTALGKLNIRVPLGATNMTAALEKALALPETGRPTAILYIGDGMSSAQWLQKDEMQQMVTRLVSRRMPVHSYAIGPQTDLQLLGVLGLQTGGYLVIDQADQKRDEASLVAGKLVKAAHQPVYYSASLKTNPELKNLYPATVLPLRNDRETIYLGKGELPTQVTVTTAGQVNNAPANLDWTISTKDAGLGDSYLAGLWQQADQNGGITVDLAGLDMLKNSQNTFNVQLDQLAALGEQAIAFRNADQAEKFAASLENMDPGNVRAKAIQTAAGQVEKNQKNLIDNLIALQPDNGSLLDDVVPPAPGNNVQPPVPGALPAEPSEPSELENLLQQQQILDEQMRVYVNNQIQEARALINSNPDEAINLVKRAQAQVQGTSVSPSVSSQLLRTLYALEQQMINAREKIELERQQALERIIQVRARQRLIEQMMLEEQRIEQLIDRVRALMVEAVHGNDDAYEEAEIVAEAIVDLRPGHPIATAALFTAEAAGQLNKAFRLRSLRADRFLETLYQVELSHVPFPDEPPVRWPPAEVWKALTERRRKWASVDLHKASPAEQRIQEALGETTEIEFLNTPLKDAMDFLGDLHNITIILDEAALGEEAIDPDTPINQVVSGISLRSALRIILQPLGLRYIIQDEVMKITTEIAAEDLARYGSTRVYPVGDLVIPITNPLAGGLGQGFGGVGGFQGQGGLGQGGQFGQGAAGFGGQQQGLGGGLFSVLPPALPKNFKPMAQPRPNDNKAQNNQPQAPKPLADPEAQELLDGILGKQKTSAAPVLTGQVFAQVREEFRLDNQSIENLKKKP